MTNLLKAMAGAAGGSAAGGYEVDNSVRFNDDDNPYMSKTWGSAPTDARQFAVILWFKPCNVVDYMYHWTCNTGTVDGRIHAGYDTNQRLSITMWQSASWKKIITTRQFRDPTSWYHVMYVVDIDNGTSADRFQIWVNGVRETDFDTETQPSTGTDVLFLKSGETAVLGANADGSNYYHDGYFSQYIVQDGEAPTDMSHVGEFDDEGEWRPIDVTGLTFGANGFLLAFSTAPGTGNGAGTDVSGNDNHFTDSGLAAADQVTDSPTNNFCTIASNSEPLHAGTGVWTVANGNTEAGLASGTGDMHYRTTMQVSEGEWYWEDTVGTQGAWGDMFGILEINTGGLYSVHNYNGSLNADTTTNSTSGGAQGYGSGLSSGDTVCNHLDLESGEYSMRVNGGSWREQLTGMSGAWSPMIGMNNQTASFQGNWGTSPRGSGGNADDNGYGDFDYAPPTNALSLCTANMTALTFDPAEHHQVELVNNDYIAYGAGTVIGDMTDSTAGNALANAFDDTTVSDDNGNSSAKRGTVTDAFAGKDWGSGVSRTINRFDVWDVNNAGYFDNTSEGRIHLYGSDSTPSNATDGTVLFSSAAFNSTVASQPKSYDVSDGIITTTAYRYHWVAFVPTSSASNVRCGEIQFYENFFTLGWNADTYDTLFIIKNRDSSEAWFWIDGLNGYDKYYRTSTVGDTQQTDANIISVSGTTITLGSTLAADNYVVECHRAGDAGGAENTEGTPITTTVSANSTTQFSIVNYTGTGVNATVGHGLSGADVVMAFADAAETSICGHTGAGWTGTLRLDATSAQSTDATVWQDTAPNPTVVTIGTYQSVNKSSTAITLYCFKAVEGYSAFGSYEGNNSPTGPVLNTGTNANSVIFKSIDGVKQWSMMRSATEDGNTGATNQMYPDQTQTESGAGTEDVDFISPGIKLRTTDNAINAAETYIYGMWGTPTVNKSGTPAKAR